MGDTAQPRDFRAAAFVVAYAHRSRGCIMPSAFSFDPLLACPPLTSHHITSPPPPPHAQSASPTPTGEVRIAGIVAAGQYVLRVRPVGFIDFNKISNVRVRACLVRCGASGGTDSWLMPGQAFHTMILAFCTFPSMPNPRAVTYPPVSDDDADVGGGPPGRGRPTLHRHALSR